MNKSLLALAATLVLSTVPLSAPVVASSAIVRCKSADGSLIYTDKACSAFGAKATPMSGELLTRIAREERRGATANALAPGIEAMPWADADVPLDTGTGTMATGRRAPASGCARTPTQLAMDLRGALALGDVNRVAESYHWAGMSTKAGERTLDRLQQLTGKQVEDSHYFDARIGFADDWVASTGSTNGADAGMLQVTLNDRGSRQMVDFDVHRFAGCYFVSF